jgi:lipoprotein-releasing system permease protein
LRGEVDMTHLPLVVDPLHYLIAAGFALGSAGVAGYLPARQGGAAQPGRHHPGCDMSALIETRT